MAQLRQAYDPNSREPSRGFEALPLGWYMVAIVADEYKPNSKQNGFLLALEMEVLDGPRKGSRAFDNLNLENPSNKAVEIAERDLTAYSYAVGYMQQIINTEVLHNIPFWIKVGPRKDGSEGNDIKDRLSIQEYNAKYGQAVAASNGAMPAPATAQPPAPAPNGFAATPPAPGVAPTVQPGMPAQAAPAQPPAQTPPAQTPPAPVPPAQPLGVNAPVEAPWGAQPAQ